MSQDTARQVKSYTDYAADQGHSEIDQLRAQVKDLTDKATRAGQNALSDAQDAVHRNIGDIEQQIRDKPVQSTLIAAGVGFLVGAVLIR
jgi:ElaB/YqjD/DUF883 family membrane-anchored ribosome-binding protein